METPSPSSEPIPRSTWYAPAERAAPAEVSRFARVCLENPIIKVVLESVDGFVLILNRQRQVVAANPEVLEEIEIVDDAAILGMRPGELFGCIHSKDEEGGCGTSRHCTTCGGVITIMASQVKRQSVSGECLMMVKHRGIVEAREFAVRATPLSLCNDEVIIFTIHDISAWKRRELMESLFLHDTLNIVTSLQTWSELLMQQFHDAEKAAENIVQLSNKLNFEVQHHRLLLLAERGELTPQKELFSCSALFDDLRTMFDGYRTGNQSRFVAVPPAEQCMLCIDYQLLSRIIINMIKNALEASEPAGIVHASFEVTDGQPCFVVHNDGVIPEAVQLQIFKRSFSTKGGSGRGIGTYSMKLFGERYLGGKVSFRTSEAEGTSFSFILPKKAVHVEDSGPEQNKATSG